jgi:hypothetical protein
MDQQQRIFDLAADMGADPKEVKAAIRVMQSGRTDLLIEILATRMSVKAALAKAALPRPAKAPLSPTTNSGGKGDGLPASQTGYSARDPRKEGKYND